MAYSGISEKIAPNDITPPSLVEMSITPLRESLVVRVISQGNPTAWVNDEMPKTTGFSQLRRVAGGRRREVGVRIDRARRERSEAVAYTPPALESQRGKTTGAGGVRIVLA